MIKKFLSKILVMIMLLNLTIPHMTIFASSEGSDLTAYETESSVVETVINEEVETYKEGLEVVFEDLDLEDYDIDSELIDEPLYDEVLDESEDLKSGEETSIGLDETNYSETIDVAYEKIIENKINESEEVDEEKEVACDIENTSSDSVLDFDDNTVESDTMLDAEVEMGGGQLKLSMVVKKKI